jgi:hypothetical protein
MLKHTRPKNGHIGLTQRCWENIRQGLLRCQQDTKVLDRCIERCTYSYQKGNVTQKVWIRILDGSLPGKINEVLLTENFFDLSEDDMQFWENHVQNHPFAEIFALERYEQLKEMRKQKNDD